MGHIASIFPFLVVPMILFMVVVMPVWITMHYKTKERSQRALSDQERDEFERLIEQAEKMADRIETLEAILDSQTPGWRKQHDRGA